jgi:hypothetical protein
MQEMSGIAETLELVKGYAQAAELLKHWLDDSGTPFQIDSQQLMNDIPDFLTSVNAEIAKGTAKGGNFDSGWKSDSVARQLPTNSSAKVLNWYYALNGYQYRVRGQQSEEGCTKADGCRTVETVTVDVFKRYNWGNPAGGVPRNNLTALGGLVNVSQNDLAGLNQDGEAHDLNVWGEYTYTQVSR